MSVKSKRITDKSTVTVVDDVGINQEELMSQEEDTKEEVEGTKASAQDILKQVMERRRELQTPTKKISYKFGVIGCGHAGSRIAESFCELGYDAVVINTATQDLHNINVPEGNKLFLDVGVQGAAKDLSRGEEAANVYRDEILELVSSKLGAAEIIVLASSTAGGSGAGSLPVMVDVLQNVGKPIVMICVLPMVSEDFKAKSNALDTLSNVSGYVRTGKVHNLIVVDNAKIESIFAGVGQMEFFKIANRAIVEPLDVFNRFSMMDSPVKPLDSAEFGTILLNGEGVSVYGQMDVANYEDPTAIGEAVFTGLGDNLLAGGFDLKGSKFFGFMAIANKEVWSKVTAGSVDFAQSMISDLCGMPETKYMGIYEDDTVEDDVVKIYTFVSGLGLPEDRIKGLKADVAAQQAVIKEKDLNRGKNLTVDLGKDTTVSKVDEMKKKIQQKMKGLGKLNSFVIDKRNK